MRVSGVQTLCLLIILCLRTCNLALLVSQRLSLPLSLCLLISIVLDGWLLFQKGRSK
jgi:uncharacterized integral membrane protein